MTEGCGLLPIGRRLVISSLSEIMRSTEVVVIIEVEALVKEISAAMVEALAISLRMQ